VNRLLRRSGDQLGRGLLLLAIIAVTGVGFGFAAGYPVSRIEFEDSDAVRLDHTRLAGEVDPEAALVAQSDLPLTWTAGDPAVGAFGLLGLGFCGEEVDLPTTLSSKEVAVFSNPVDQAFLISETVRVDRWQSARDYVDDVADAVRSCDEFFRTDPLGQRIRVKIAEGIGDPPITDHVAHQFIAEDGSSVQVWSLMAVGDVLIALQHIGPERPQEGFLEDVENKILIRIDPEDFAPGGVPTTTTSSVPTDGTSTTLVEGGAEEEPVTEPGAPEGGEDSGVVDSGAADESGTG
jgi:hypothetical protein